MKKLVFVKQSINNDVSHLYEHIFYDELISFLKKRGFYEYIDFMIIANTFTNGLIIFDISFLQNITLDLCNSILEIKINDSDINILTHIRQIESEKRHTLVYPSISILKTEINAISENNWTLISEFNTSINLDSSEKKVICFDSKEFERNEILSISLNLDSKFIKSNRKISPVTNRLLILYCYAIQQAIVEKYGLFFEGDETIYNDSYTLTMKFNIHNYFVFDLDGLANILRSAVEDLFNDNCIERFISRFTDIELHSDSIFMDDFIDIYSTTGVIMGVCGWKEVATMSNIKKISKNIKVNVDYDDVRYEV